MIGRAWAIGLLWRGHRLIKRGRHDQAFRLMDRAVKLWPTHAGILNHRGLCYLQFADHERAFADFSSAIEQSRPFMLPYHNRGVTSMQMGEYERAQVDLEAARVRAPKFARTYAVMAAVAIQQQDYDGAIVRLTTAIELAPKEPEVWDARGLAKFYSGEFVSAAGDLRQALNLAAQRRPKLVLPGALLFGYLAEARQGLDATAMLRRDAQTFNPDGWLAQVISFYLGQLTADGLVAAASNPGQHAEAQFYIGQQLLLNGETVAAVKALRAALRLAPEQYIERAGALAELKRLGMAQHSG
jgi:lipoprotein NlpI